MAIGLDDVSEAKGRRKHSASPGADMSMMRVAVAGTGGLARLIAHYIAEDTAHPVVFISRTAQPQLAALGYQVLLVDYNDIETLKFALRGIDTVISTVTGPNQIELIHAAVAARVRRFAPAEFEGLAQYRSLNDPLDRHRTLALSWLQHYAQNIQSTKFVCGILYERFQPGGLAHSRMGLTSGFNGEGDYIMNCRNMNASVPAYDSNNVSNVTIVMTAAQDVARFVTKAVDLQSWPPELSMYGEQVQVRNLIASVQHWKGQPFNPIYWHNPASLRSELQLAAAQRDNARGIRLHTHIATAEGRYNFNHFNLNAAFPDVHPISFKDWFVAKWNLQQ